MGSMASEAGKSTSWVPGHKKESSQEQAMLLWQSLIRLMSLNITELKSDSTKNVLSCPVLLFHQRGCQWLVTIRIGKCHAQPLQAEKAPWWQLEDWRRMRKRNKYMYIIYIYILYLSHLFPTSSWRICSNPTQIAEYCRHVMQGASFLTQKNSTEACQPNSNEWAKGTHWKNLMIIIHLSWWYETTPAPAVPRHRQLSIHVRPLPLCLQHHLKSTVHWDLRLTMTSSIDLSCCKRIWHRCPSKASKSFHVQSSNHPRFCLCLIEVSYAGCPVPYKRPPQRKLYLG